jgi:hypothetical protein
MTEYQKQEYETLKEFEDYINNKYGSKQEVFYVADIIEYFSKFNLTLHDGMYIRDKLHKLRLNRDVLKNDNGVEEV